VNCFLLHCPSAGVFAVPGNENQVDWSCPSVLGRFAVGGQGHDKDYSRGVHNASSIEGCGKPMDVHSRGKRTK